MTRREDLRRSGVYRRGSHIVARVVARVVGGLRRLTAAREAGRRGADGVPGPDVSLDELSSVWSASAREQILQRHSHWRGAPGFDDDAWLEIGRRTRGYVEELLTERDDAAQRSSGLEVLEWGPGGGSNVVAMAPLTRRYIGVEISDPNLAECRRQAEAAGFEGFEAFHLQDRPRSVADQVDGPVDVLICTSVFQHFPSIEYGQEVLEAMRAVSHPGTVGVVQVRYAERSHRRPPTGQYRDDYIHASIHPLPDFWWSLVRAGFTPLRIVDLDEPTRYAWFLFRATP